MTAQANELTRDVLAQLKEPLPSRFVSWKIQQKTRDGKRALVVAYADARLMMTRLDEVVGPANWHDEYEVLSDREWVEVGPDGKEVRRRHVEVRCRLTVLGVTKEDVGDGGDLKAAFTDAFKRACVKFGLTRYLYFLPTKWVDLDDKGRFTPPQLPAWALPKAERNGRNGKAA